MLSNKWTFSLTSLVLMLALCFVAPSALAQFEIGLSVGDKDVSFADGNQVVYGTDTTIRITSPKVVNFTTIVATEVAADATVTATTGLEAIDFDVIAYNEFGGTVGAPALGAVGVVDAGPADGKHFMASLDSVADTTGITRVVLVLKAKSVELADPRAEMDATTNMRKPAGQNKETSIELLYVAADEGDPDGEAEGSLAPGTPIVHKIIRAGGALRPVTAETFEVIITLSEMPRKDGFKKDHIDVTHATAGDPTFLDKMAGAADIATGMVSSGRDMMLYRYIVVITPKYENKNDIVVKVKSFYDQEKMMMKMYMPPSQPAAYKEGMDKLTVKVGKEDLKAKVAGVKFALPKEKHIPAGGYLVVAEDKGGSSVHVPPGEIKDAPKPHERTPAERMYNVIDDGDLPNLETFLANGGVIDVVSPHALIITEIMWGSDASLDDPGKSQWIELYNAGAEYKTVDGDNTTYLVFYGPGDVLPAVTTVKDRVGTVDAVNGYWSLAGKGQSGRTAEKIQGKSVDAVPTVALISMNRVMSAGTVASGTMASSWMLSVPPSSNFEANRLGTHIGSPGAMPVTFPAPPALEPAPAPSPVVPVAMASDIMISEIMVDTGDGRLPQWIELTNVSRAEKSLAGWSVQITNSEADADVIGSSVRINLSGILGIGGGEDRGGDLGKALLLVSGSARSSSNLAGSDRVVDVSIQLDQKGRYKLISDMGFMIALVPPQDTGVLVYGDTAGNLDAAEAWEIPMDENGRSSLIRRKVDVDGMATMGTAANSWVLASSTQLVETPTTWYGSDEDAGTPGVIGGGPLPVELSMFYPARDKVTGAVVITWSTQSELNNAGFFIKRSQQRKGEFKVVNATMIAGAGTTSEKQSYTYTDETAQPNVVYYYQIEDVSLDGNRQTLTNGIRLKGHIGAAGKATTTWGDLKIQE